MEAKPNLKKFKLAFRGYDTDEVDSYIERTEKYENSLNEQKTRIFELLEENERLRSQVDELKKMQDSISSALLEATKKAEQIVAEARGLADSEIERVKLFQSKWEYFADKMLGELAPKQKLLYEKLSRRIDETLKRFCLETEEKTSNGDKLEETEKKVKEFKAEATEAVRFVKPAAALTEDTSVVHAIELDEVYDTSESLQDLLSELG